MPIRKKIAPQDPGLLACEADTLPARAYGGPADGRRWMVPATELADIHRFPGVRSRPYELALNPGTGGAVRDSFGRYVYLVGAQFEPLGPARPAGDILSSSVAGPGTASLASTR